MRRNTNQLRKGLPVPSMGDPLACLNI